MRGAALTTTHDLIFDWARGSALRPVRLGLACCAIEMTAALDPRHDLPWLGLPAAPPPPEAPAAASDVLLVAGTVSEKLAPWLRGLWEQMPEPKWAVAVGACASCGGPFPTYAVTQGVDRLLPVAVYVPGCPPAPEALLLGLMHLAEKIAREEAALTGDRLPGDRLPGDPLSGDRLPGDPLLGELHQELGEAIVAPAPGAAAPAGDMLTVEVRREDVARAAALLCGRFRYTFLVDLCAVDHPARARRFEVVYHLYSFRENRRLRLKVRAGEDEPVPSVAGVWRGAGWPEREAHEMLGVAFSGHPDLAPLLLWEGFAGHPLRKDFPLAGRDTGAAVAPPLAPAGEAP